MERIKIKTRITGTEIVWQDGEIICDQEIKSKIEETAKIFERRGCGVFVADQMVGTEKLLSRSLTAVALISAIEQLDVVEGEDPRKDITGSLDSDVKKFNPYHGKDGRFSSAGSYTSFTYAPGKSKAHDLAIQREKDRIANRMPSEAQAKTLNAIESRTRNLKKEQYRVVDRDGNVVLQKQGNKDSVAYTMGEAREHIPGNITIHNHPDGGTFSPSDLSDIGHGATEIRAASPEGTYILRNARYGTKYDAAKEKTWYDMREDIQAASEGFKKDWELKKEVRKPFDQELQPLVDKWSQRKAEGASKQELDSIAAEYTSACDEILPKIQAATRTAYVAQYDNWYKANASKYGLEYEFIPNTSTKKSDMLLDTISEEKSDGDIVLDQEFSQDVELIAGAIIEDMKNEIKTIQKSNENIVEILKTDEDKRLVFGWASIAIKTDGEQLEDHQHDMIDPEDLEEAVYDYVLNFRDTGEEHISSMRKKGKLVESCVFTEEKQRAMGLPAGIVPVGWWIGFKIEDDAAWERVKNGTYKMFSIEGRANRIPVEKAARNYDDFPSFSMWLEENLDATDEEEKAAKDHYTKLYGKTMSKPHPLLKADEKASLFIGLNVTGADGLSIEGGEDPEDFHVTLLYGYYDEQKHDSSELDLIVDSAIRAIKDDIPESIEFDQIATFEPTENSDGKRVIYARVKSGQLEEIHEKLVSEMRNHGLSIEQTFNEYRPHMTLAYVDPDEEVEEKEILESGSIQKITIGTKGREQEMNGTRTIAKTFDEIMEIPTRTINKSDPDRFDQIVEIEKYNPYHGKDGRFASANSFASYTGKPGRSYGTADTEDSKGQIDDEERYTIGGKKNSLDGFLDENGNLTPEREMVHKQIIDQLLKGKVPVQGQATMTMLGGGPASGKSSVMNPDTSNDKHAVTIDPDMMKSMLPGFKELAVSDTRAADFYHEESSMLAKRFASAAYSENYNVVYDGTGDGSNRSVQKKIQEAKGSGYKVEAKYVSIDTEEAVRRNQKRYDDAVAKGETPRLPPVEKVIKTHAQCTDISVAMAKEFDYIEIWDNNGAKGQQKLIATGGAGKGLKAVSGRQNDFNRYLKKGEKGLDGFITLPDGTVAPVE